MEGARAANALPSHQGKTPAKRMRSHFLFLATPIASSLAG